MAVRSSFYMYVYVGTYLLHLPVHPSIYYFLPYFFISYFHSLVLYNFCYLLYAYNIVYYNIKCKVMSQGPIRDIAKLLLG